MSTTTRATGESSSETTIREFLTDHPRMIGVLFMLALVITQASAPAAAGVSSIAGP